MADNRFDAFSYAGSTAQHTGYNYNPNALKSQSAETIKSMMNALKAGGEAYIQKKENDATAQVYDTTKQYNALQDKYIKDKGNLPADDFNAHNKLLEDYNTNANKLFNNIDSEKHRTPFMNSLRQFSMYQQFGNQKIEHTSKLQNFTEKANQQATAFINLPLEQQKANKQLFMDDAKVNGLTKKEAGTIYANSNYNAILLTTPENPNEYTKATIDDISNRIDKIFIDDPYLKNSDLEVKAKTFKNTLQNKYFALQVQKENLLQGDFTKYTEYTAHLKKMNEEGYYDLETLALKDSEFKTKHQDTIALNSYATTISKNPSAIVNSTTAPSKLSSKISDTNVRLGYSHIKSGNLEQLDTLATKSPSDYKKAIKNTYESLVNQVMELKSKNQFDPTNQEHLGLMKQLSVIKASVSTNINGALDKKDVFAISSVLTLLDSDKSLVPDNIEAIKSLQSNIASGQIDLNLSNDKNYTKALEDITFLDQEDKVEFTNSYNALKNSGLLTEETLSILKESFKPHSVSNAKMDNSTFKIFQGNYIYNDSRSQRTYYDELFKGFKTNTNSDMDLTDDLEITMDSNRKSIDGSLGVMTVKDNKGNTLQNIELTPTMMKEAYARTNARILKGEYADGYWTKKMYEAKGLIYPIPQVVGTIGEGISDIASEAAWGLDKIAKATDLVANTAMAVGTVLTSPVLMGVQDKSFGDVMKDTKFYKRYLAPESDKMTPINVRTTLQTAVTSYKKGAKPMIEMKDLDGYISKAKFGNKNDANVFKYKITQQWTEYELLKDKK